jgi:hypothetical protein
MGGAIAGADPDDPSKTGYIQAVPGSGGKGRAIGFDDNGNLSVNGLTVGGWTLRVV